VHKRLFRAFDAFLLCKQPSFTPLNDYRFNLKQASFTFKPAFSLKTAIFFLNRDFTIPA
jgi:hypothetical protein